MSSDLQIIPLRNNLLVDFKHNEVKTKIINRLNELGLAQPQYKTDNELLSLVCSLVEHLVVKQDKISKKDLVIDIMHIVFDLSIDEKKTLSNNIEFLWGNRMIKKVSFYKLFKTSISEWFRKKA
jgi:hypothetical protein